MTHIAERYMFDNSLVHKWHKNTCSRILMRFPKEVSHFSKNAENITQKHMSIARRCKCTLTLWIWNIPNDTNIYIYVCSRDVFQCVFFFICDYHHRLICGVWQNILIYQTNKTMHDCVLLLMEIHIYNGILILNPYHRITWILLHFMNYVFKLNCNCYTLLS